MFIPCPHCQFLVASPPQRRAQAPVLCPRCGRALDEEAAADQAADVVEATPTHHAPTAADAAPADPGPVPEPVDQPSPPAARPAFAFGRFAVPIVGRPVPAPTTAPATAPTAAQAPVPTPASESVPQPMPGPASDTSDRASPAASPAQAALLRALGAGHTATADADHEVDAVFDAVAVERESEVEVEVGREVTDADANADADAIVQTVAAVDAVDAPETAEPVDRIGAADQDAGQIPTAAGTTDIATTDIATADITAAGLIAGVGTFDADMAAATGDQASATAPAPPTGADGAGSGSPAFAARSHATGWARFRWPLVALLALLLGLQVLVADRARLAADPGWRPLLEQLCGTLACTLPPWHEPSAFTMLDRQVRPAAQDGALRVDATFRNDARWAQDWPALQLALSDADGRVLGSRVFAPADYLGAAPTTLLAPGQSAQVAFVVQEPAPGTVAFSFEFR